jgi:predicted TIM-barrel fold metal-dependent hydrolase
MTMRLTRRAFLKHTTAAVLATGTTSLSVGQAEPTQGFLGPIIDTHTHFYDPTRSQGVPWPLKDDKLLYRKVLPRDYRALPQPHPVKGTVVLEASPWVEDNQWILDLAAREPFIVGFVGNLAPGTEGFQAHLERFAGNPIFRGIRIGADHLGDRLKEARFLDDLRSLARHDLALDLLGGTEMLPDAARLARAVPNLRIVIDHVANIPIDGRTINSAWRDGMRAVGASSQSYCKVSGLVEGAGRTDGTAPREVEFYRPFLDVIWAAFGPNRLVYGSNWPVSERFAPCGVVQQIVFDYFTTKGTAALEMVFWKNSKACYKWIDRD